MNRPKYKHIRMKGKDTTYLLNHILNYRNELEKYCDELEQSNKSLSNAYDDCLFTLHFWEEMCCKYKKALDKLCKFIIENANEDCYNGCPYKIKDYWIFGNNAEDLKEWAISDDE